MARLIDVDAIDYPEYFYTREIHPDEFIEGFRQGKIDAILDIKSLSPTVDAVEVVHGRWIVLANFFDGSVCANCSVCGEEYTYKKGRLELIGVEYAKYNYCPNCGAKMDGDSSETLD